MGLAEPIEPDPDDDAPFRKGGERADWLVGAEEGIDAELQRHAQQEQGALPAPKLFRPGADAPAEAPPGTERRAQPVIPMPRLQQPTAPPDDPARPSTSRQIGVPLPVAAPGKVSADDADSGFSHGPAMLWEPGANSVPALQRPPMPATAPSAPRAPLAAVPPEMDFPMDDAEERAQASAEAAAAAAAAAERAAQPHTVVAPDAFDIKDAPAPWWMQIPQLLREDRRVQGAAALVIVLLLALAFWPRPEKSLSLGNIRRHPDRYDGKDVRVSGRIGETFEVGGGWAFYLHQGRDTLVVFTRSRTPHRGQNVTLLGTVSTGYLDGQACSAVFEASR